MSVAEVVVSLLQCTLELLDTAQTQLAEEKTAGWQVLDLPSEAIRASEEFGVKRPTFPDWITYTI